MLFLRTLVRYVFPNACRGLIGLGCLAGGTVVAAETYGLDLSGPVQKVQRGHLDLGGTGPNGQSIQVNSFYIEVDGKPFIPVVGEFHYSRYPAEEWEDALRAIKAGGVKGGVNVVASYVFWSLHERKRGEFDWKGNLDLRKFVELVDRVGLKMILRVGPFGHGEIRNGGLPDWIYGQPFEVRSNDAGYLELTDKLYAQIGAQVGKRVSTFSCALGHSLCRLSDYAHGGRARYQRHSSGGKR
jgi:hypothetical protein